jgi:hypothetical protein
VLLSIRNPVEKSVAPRFRGAPGAERAIINHPIALALAYDVILIELLIKFDGALRVLGHPLKIAAVANVFSLWWHGALIAG